MPLTLALQRIGESTSLPFCFFDSPFAVVVAYKTLSAGIIKHFENMCSCAQNTVTDGCMAKHVGLLINRHASLSSIPTP